MIKIEILLNCFNKKVGYMEGKEYRMRKFVRAMCHPGAQSAIGSIMVLLLTIALIACGGDSGTSANDDDSSSSSVTLSGTSVESNGSKTSSSSKKVESSSSQKMASSSSVKKESSSSVKAASSSSVIPASSGNPPSSSSKKVESSSSQKIASSSSLNNDVSSGIEYKPYAHDTCLAGNWNIHKDVYKQFTDPRNGRSYYYYTATSHKTGKKVTVMAENLNIGDMVLGENDQNDDTKIERYCYNNDTTNCDKYGGLYQWAEMMQLPSSCNTESCYKKIRRDHRGICPEGWRLFTWNDYEIIRDYNDQYGDGIKGLRSQCFHGSNASGFSLIGGGKRTKKGTFEKLDNVAYWYYPEEDDYDLKLYAHFAYVMNLVNDSPTKNDGDEKSYGLSVRCTKIE